jgi:rhodanese-related sulfurtransferase
MASPSGTFEQISVEALADRLATQREQVQFIDVREPQEIAIAQVEGFEVLPLSQFGEWSETIQTRLDPSKETVVMCHHGMRSAQMCQWLVNQGFTNVKNIAGGIDAYSAMVDPTVPRY